MFCQKSTGRFAEMSARSAPKNISENKPFLLFWRACQSPCQTKARLEIRKWSSSTLKKTKTKPKQVWTSFLISLITLERKCISLHEIPPRLMFHAETTDKFKMYFFRVLVIFYSVTLLSMNNKWLGGGNVHPTAWMCFSLKRTGSFSFVQPMQLFMYLPPGQLHGAKQSLCKDFASRARVLSDRWGDCVSAQTCRRGDASDAVHQGSPVPRGASESFDIDKPTAHKSPWVCIKWQR